MEIALIITSSTILLLLGFIGKLLSKIDKLNKTMDSMKENVDNKVKQLENKIKAQEELVSIEPGDKAILPNYGLSVKSTNESFTVTYEVEIIEVSTKKVKVNALDYQSNDNFPSDPKNKKSIINFLQNTWIDRKDIQLIVDDQIRRERKLNQILDI
jgi:hypothetical protein